MNKSGNIPDWQGKETGGGGKSAGMAKKQKYNAGYFGAITYCKNICIINGISSPQKLPHLTN
jgi:hypothetical protein